MADRLAGKVAIITGAGGEGGIGAATARLFACEGAKVAVVDLAGDDCERTAAAVRAAIPAAEVLPVGADVTREADVARAVAQTVARFGTVTTLVNNASIREYTAVAEATTESWQRILAVNLIGMAACCRAALPHLRKAKGASIVNVSSVHAVVGRPGMGQYDATKAGILAMTRTLACEEASHSVRVNAVCPGGTLTGYHIDRFRREGLDLARTRAERKPDNAMGRWAEPVEIAYPILWLASDEASFVTGTSLMADGGTM